MDDPVHISATFPGKSLLTFLASSRENELSEECMQMLSTGFAKISFSTCLDYANLKTVFEHLRGYSSLRGVLGLIPHLANVYDTLLYRDLGQRAVSDSVCELLFLIEDLADDRDCKVITGKYFLSRLVALARSQVNGIRMQRAAVETLSSLILMCPENQRIVLDELHTQWQRIVKELLPRCGDFFVQASIVEMLYRLSKKAPHLLDCLEDDKLIEMIRALHNAKKPDLHGGTRAFLDHFNRSLGSSRSVCSCLADDIHVNGKSKALKRERWVHFGIDHISLYAALHLKSSEDISLLDVFYTKISEFQTCSKDNRIELILQSQGLLQSEESEHYQQQKMDKLVIRLKPEDFALVKDYVLPRINYFRKQPQKTQSCRKGGNSENISMTPSTSAKSIRFSHKASVGYAIPLPKKLKLPSVSSPYRIMQNDLLSNGRQDETITKQNNSVTNDAAAIITSNKSDEQCKSRIEYINSGKEATINEKKCSRGNCTIDDRRRWTDKEGTPLGKVEMVDLLRGFSENECQQRTVVDQNQNKNAELCFPGNKEYNLGKSLPQKDAITNANDYTAAGRGRTVSCREKVTRKLRQVEKGPGDLKENSTAHIIDAKFVDQSKCTPFLKFVGGNETNAVGVSTLENSVVQNNIRKRALVKNKLADPKQVDQLRERILHILQDANVARTSRPNENFSISDPIETDSGHKPDVSKQNNKMRGKTALKHVKNLCFNSVPTRKYLKKGRDARSKSEALCKSEKVPKNDAFCFSSEHKLRENHRNRDYDIHNKDNSVLDGHNKGDLQTAFTPTVDDFEISHLLNRSCTRNIELGRIKKPRLSLKSDAEHSIKRDAPINDNLLACADAYVTTPPRASGIFAPAARSVKENRIHLVSATPTEMQIGKSSAQRCNSSPNYRVDGQYHKAFNIKQRNGNSILQEIAAIYPDDATANREMQLFSDSLQKMINQIKVSKDRKSTEILASAKENIMNRCQEAQKHIEADLEEYKRLTIEKFGQLQSKLQDECESLKCTHRNWRNELHNHLQHFKDISSQVEEAESYIKGVSDKQKIDHTKLYAEVNDFAEVHMTEAEQRLITLQKTTKDIRNELKKAIVEML